MAPSLASWRADKNLSAPNELRLSDQIIFTNSHTVTIRLDQFAIAPPIIILIDFKGIADAGSVSLSVKSILRL